MQYFRLKYLKKRAEFCLFLSCYVRENGMALDKKFLANPKNDWYSKCSSSVESGAELFFSRDLYDRYPDIQDTSDSAESPAPAQKEKSLEDELWVA